MLPGEHRGESRDQGFRDAVASSRRAETRCFFVAFFYGPYEIFGDVVQSLDICVRVSETGLKLWAIELELRCNRRKVYNSSALRE